MRSADDQLFMEMLRTHNLQYGALLRTRAMRVPVGGRGDDSTTSAEVAARLLGERPADSRLLFYAHHDGQLHAFVLDRDGLRSHGAVAVEEEVLVRAMEETRFALATGGLQRARDFMTWVEPTPGFAPGELQARGSGLLFARETAAALAGASEVIVVPTLNIGVVPFAALDPGGTGTPLVERATITIAPNAFDLERTPPRAPSAGEPLVVGDPAGAGLPGALAEATYVADKLGVTPLVGAAATKQEVVARMEAARILYFATHGSADAADPLHEGALQLADGEELTAWEIQRSALSAELAVLSACRTGLGAAHPGGMIGLARAFLLAGVPQVVMSLWSVDDATTLALMRHFWDERARWPTQEALRRAMLRIREERPEPACWAPFVVFGIP